MLASAAFIRSGVIGTRPMRGPVASKIAFATAAGTVRVEGSPAPCGGVLSRSIGTMSIDSGCFPRAPPRVLPVYFCATHVTLGSGALSTAHKALIALAIIKRT